MGFLHTFYPLTLLVFLFLLVHSRTIYEILKSCFESTPPAVLAKAGDQQLEVRYLFDGTPGLDPPESVCVGVGWGWGVSLG